MAKALNELLSDLDFEVPAAGDPLAAAPRAQVAGMLQPGNIDLHRRPVVRNKDGSISTVRSMSANFDGKEYLIPTVAADGSGILSEQGAVDQFRKSGQHLGVFDTPENATAYASSLHQDQAREYAGALGAPPAVRPKKPLAALLAENDFEVPQAPDKPWTDDLREIGRQAAGSVVVGVPEQAGQVLKWASAPGQPAYETGQRWVDSARARAPGWEPDMEGRGPIAETLIKGAGQIGPSVAGPLAAAPVVAGAAALGLPAAAGLGAAAALGAIPMGMAQAQDTYERVKATGADEDTALRAARINQAIETGGETIGSFVGGKLLGAGARAMRRGVDKPIAEAVRSVTDPAVLKPLAKAAGTAMVLEPATEFGQGFGQAAVEQAAGVPGLDPLAQGLEGAQAAVGMTALGLPFGVVGHTVQGRRNAAVAQALADPATDPAARLRAAETVARQVDQVDPAAGAAVRANAAEAIAAGRALPVDDSLAVRAAPAGGAGGTAGTAAPGGVDGGAGVVPGGAGAGMPRPGDGIAGGLGAGASGAGDISGRAGGQLGGALETAPPPGVDPATGELLSAPPVAPRGPIGRAVDVAAASGAIPTWTKPTATVVPADPLAATPGAEPAAQASPTPDPVPSSTPRRAWETVPNEAGGIQGFGIRSEPVGDERGTVFVSPGRDGTWELRAGTRLAQGGIKGAIHRDVFPDQTSAQAGGEAWLAQWEAERAQPKASPQAAAQNEASTGEEARGARRAGGATWQKPEAKIIPQPRDTGPDGAPASTTEQTDGEERQGQTEALLNAEPPATGAPAWQKPSAQDRPDAARVVANRTVRPQSRLAAVIEARAGVGQTKTPVAGQSWGWEKPEAVAKKPAGRAVVRNGEWGVVDQDGQFWRAANKQDAERMASGWATVEPGTPADAQPTETPEPGTPGEAEPTTPTTPQAAGPQWRKPTAQDRPDAQKVVDARTVKPKSRLAEMIEQRTGVTAGRTPTAGQAWEWDKPTAEDKRAEKAEAPQATALDKKWDAATRHERVKMLESAGYTDYATANAVVGSAWNQLGDQIRRALDRANRQASGVGVLKSRDTSKAAAIAHLKAGGRIEDGNGTQHWISKVERGEAGNTWVIHDKDADSEFSGQKGPGPYGQWGPDEAAQKVLERIFDWPEEAGTMAPGPMPETAADEKPADPDAHPYKAGERVVIRDSSVLAGRHGTVTKAETFGWTTVGAGARTSTREHYVAVKTDGGVAALALPVRFVERESGAAPAAVPDIEIDGAFFLPQNVFADIERWRNSAKNARAAAIRARKPESKREHMESAKQKDAKAEAYRAAFEAWATAHPAEAAEASGGQWSASGGAAPAPTATAPTQGKVLAAPQASKTKKGAAVWVVSILDRVERPEYERLKAEAEQHGGYWFSGRGVRGAVPGFSFSEEYRAQRFFNAIEAPEAAPVAVPDEPTLKRGEIRPDGSPYVYRRQGGQWQWQPAARGTPTTENGEIGPGWRNLSPPPEFRATLERLLVEKWPEGESAAAAPETAPSATASGVTQIDARALADQRRRLIADLMKDRALIEVGRGDLKAGNIEAWRSQTLPPRVRAWIGGEVFAGRMDNASNNYFLEHAKNPEWLKRLGDELLRETEAPAALSSQGSQQLGQKDEAPAAFGAGNTVFTQSAADAARERLRKKLGTVRSGLDPELLQDGILLAGYYIEGGIREFGAWSRRMVADLGEAARPYLRAWYEGVRYYPGVDAAGMSSAAEIEALPQGPAAPADNQDAVATTNGPNAEQGNDSEFTTTDRDGAASAAGQGADAVPGADRAGTGGDVRGGKGGADAGRVRGADQSALDGDTQREERPGDAGTHAGGNLSGATDLGADPGERARISRGHDYRIQPGELTRQGSWLEAARRNVDAVELIARLEQEQRPPTPEEQAKLVQFVGWGPGEIRNNLFPPHAGLGKNYTPYSARGKEWQALGERVKDVFTEDDWKTVARSTQYAHYTSEKIIRAIYAGLGRLGFAGGSVVEPGAGIGLFAGLMPDNLYQASTYLGIELDGFSAKIGQALFPSQTMRQADFTRQKLPKNFFDLAIGNPPFADIKVLSDPEYRKQKFLLHDYFFAKTLDSVRPGGLLVFVTSNGTLDKKATVARDYLSARADLLGAIRLPQTAFKQNAGTEVVTDVLFLKKRAAGAEPAGPAWQASVPIQVDGTEQFINEYYVAHPEMVLGTHSAEGTMYAGKSYTVKPIEGDIEDLFAQAVQRLPANVYSVFAPTVAPTTQQAKTIERDFNPKHRKEGGVYLNDDGELLRVERGIGVPLAEVEPKLTAKERALLKAYVPLRDALKQAHYDQLADGDWQTSLQALNAAYDAFVAQQGPVWAFTVTERKELDEDGNETVVEVRRYKNERALRTDVEYTLVHALESIKEDGTIEKGPVLKDRVLKRPAPPKVETISDALAVSLAETGAFDLDHVARLFGVEPAEAAQQLGDLIYEQPSGGWVMADAYLSGDVKHKLELARIAAQHNRRFERNVSALEAVQPQVLGAGDISVQLGAAWIPADYVAQFGREVLGIAGAAVSYAKATGGWAVSGKAGKFVSRTGSAEWGTAYRSPTELLDAVLNKRQIRVYDTVKDGAGRTSTVFNETETVAANDMAKRMADEFASWVWTEARRASDLLSRYNETFNRYSPREFNGDHLNPPGLSLKYKLHPHQKRAVWRQIQTGNVYLAHAVGAGKTLEMIIGGMEQRRLGLIKKPMYVVPNHMLQQFAREFMEAYPAANILVANEQNFHTDNRRRFVAQAALNDPDAVVITHSAFRLLQLRTENKAAAFESILDDLREQLLELDEDDQAQKRTRSQIEKRIERLEQQLEGKTKADKQDTALYFEDLGVDYLYVDEAHAYRKLDFATNLKVKGLSPEGSQQALDMYAKTRWLDSQRPGRAYTFASGTPITNSMAEMYTVQRFFQDALMREEGLHHFDAWASMFGRVAKFYERNATGGIEVIERFGKFVNVYDMMSRALEFMDVLTSPQLASLIKVPDVRPGNAGRRELISVEQSENLGEYLSGELSRRLEASRQWKPTREEPNNPDPVIAIIGDGRLAAIDFRYVDPGLPDDKRSKLNRMCDEIIRIHDATAELEYTDPDTGEVDPTRGATQIVFASNGFGEGVIKNRGFDSRAWVMKRFKDAGIPASQVACIWDYKDATKKEALFKEVRQGKKRILIGSPKNMGTGVNVQRRLIALHHLDAPWYPSDLEQPEGRIVRQGNQNREVQLYGYATDGTYDSTMWTMVSQKSGFIEQAFKGDRRLRTMDDISESSQYALAAAIASGDPRYMQLAELETDVTRLETLRKAHDNRQNSLQWDIGRTERALEAQRGAMAAAKQVAEALAGQIFYSGYLSGTVGERTFTRAKTSEVGDALLAAYRQVAEYVVGQVQDRAKRSKERVKFPFERELGTINGVTLRVEGELAAKQNSAGEVELLVLGSEVDLIARAAGHDIATLWSRRSVPEDGERAGGALTRTAVDAQNAVARQERKREELKTELEGYRARYGAPFPQEQEYVEKLAALESLRAELTKTEETIDPATLGVPADPETVAEDAETTGPDGATDGDRVEARRAKYGDDPYTVDLFGQPVRPARVPAPDLNLDLDGAKAAPDLFVGANKKGAPVSRLAAKVAQVRTGQITTAFPQVRTWDEAAHATAQLRKFPQEHFLSLVLDGSGKILAALRHTIGVRDGSQVSVSLVAGSIYAIPGAKQVVFAHNHPSGVARLSAADVSITRRLYDLMKGTGVEPWGILAVGGGQYGFIDTRFGEASGEQERPIPPGRRRTEVPILERVYRKAGRLSETTLSAPKVAVELANQLLPEHSGLLLLDNQHRPIGTVPLTRPELRQLRREGGPAARILQAFHETNAAAAIFVSRTAAVAEADIQNLGKMISLSDVRFLDVVESGGGESWSWSSVGKSLVGDLSEPDYYAAGSGFNEANIERNRPLVEGIRRTLAQVAPGANVEVLERIVGGEGMARSGGAAGAFAAGSYSPVSSTIRVALNYRDPQQTAFHEAIHFLRQAGLFQPVEWAALERQAAKAWAQRYGVTDTEEAIAYGTADFLRAPADDVGGLVRKALNKVRAFFERLAAWLRGEGFQTFEDVLRKVGAGEVGARQGQRVRNAEQLASAGAPRTGRVHFNSWAGRSAKRVEILDETPKRYRVRLLEDAVGRKSGDEFLAPKDAVTLDDESDRFAVGGDTAAGVFRISATEIGAADPITIVRAPPSRFESAKVALRWAIDNLRGTYQNRRTGWAIDVARAGLEKALSHSGRAGGSHLGAITAVPRLLESAVLVESRPSLKSEGIRAIHRFYAPLKIGSGLYRVKITVKETMQGKKFYDQSLTEIEEADAQMVGGMESQGPESRAATGPSALTMSLGRLLEGVNFDDGTPIYQSVRFSSGTEAAEADPFAEVDAAVRADTALGRSGRALTERYHALKGGAKRQMLGALSVRQLAEVGKELLPGITEYVDHMQGMAATRSQVFDAADKIAQDWQKLDKNAVVNRIQQGRLALVMHEATLAGVDPSEDYAPSLDVEAAVKQIGILKQQAYQRSGENQAQRLQDIAELKAKLGFEAKRKAAYAGMVKLWNGLSPAAQAIYRRARDYHVAQMRRVEDALIETIEKSTLAAKAKAESIAKMRQEFEAWRVQAPYFPLSREGEYWVYAKPEGGNAEFHMFKTIEQQEDFRAEQARAGWTILGHGKQTENLREVVGVSAAFVDEIEKAIGTLGNDPMVNAVRDQVYQLYLATMPALSVRKHHIHRKKTPGFGQDALRAFAEKSYHDAYQYARLKHGLDLRQTMEDLRADLDAVGRPGKLAEAERKLALLTEFRDDVMGKLTVREVAARVDSLDARALEDPGLVPELEKWRQFAEWMADWARRGGIPAQVARQIAVLERRQATAARVNAAERGFDAATNVYNELQQAYQHLMTPNTSPAANLVNQVGFLWYLGFSPSAWIVNALQTPMVSLPYVAAKFGMGKTAAAFASAYRRAFAKDQESLFSIRGTLTGEALAAYDEAVAMGLIDRTRAHDLAGLAEEGTARSGLNRTFMGLATAGFHHAERLNREVTFVAAFELARENGMSTPEAAQYAADVVWKTHLDYAAENRPRFLRGNIARIIGQFKLYSQGVTYLIGRAVLEATRGASPAVRAEARRFLAYQFGLQFAAAGAMGLPVGAAWMLAKGLVAGDDDEPEDFEGLFRQAMADWTGSATGGQAASVGAVNALTPIDLHSRVSLRDLWLREPDKAVEGRDGAYWVLSSIMGPMAGIIEQGLVGAQLINEGRTYRGIEKMLPNAANDAAKALRLATEGAKTLKGDELISDVTAAEVFATAVGFNLSRLESRYAENSARKGVEQRIEDRRRLLLRQAVEARAAGDGERFRELQAEIRAFNEANPARMITPRSILQSAKTRARYRAQAEHGLALNPKLRGDLVERYRFAE